VVVVVVVVAASAWPQITAPANASATIVLIILRSPNLRARNGGVALLKFLTDVGTMRQPPIF
jgi:hypothetical protein